MFAEIIENGVAWKEICVKVKLYKLLEFYILYKSVSDHKNEP